MSDDEIRQAHAYIVARESAIIRMINFWDCDAQPSPKPVLRSVSVPAAARDRSEPNGGFPVLIESF